jgi:hypothetical protein
LAKKLPEFFSRVDIRFFEILKVKVIFGLHYEYAKISWKQLIFDRFYDFYYFICYGPKNKQKVGKKLFLATFVE